MIRLIAMFLIAAALIAAKALFLVASEAPSPPTRGGVAACAAHYSEDCLIELYQRAVENSADSKRAALEVAPLLKGGLRNGNTRNFERVAASFSHLLRRIATETIGYDDINTVLKLAWAADGVGDPSSGASLRRSVMASAESLDPWQRTVSLDNMTCAYVAAGSIFEATRAALELLQSSRDLSSAFDRRRALQRAAGALADVGLVSLSFQTLFELMLGESGDPDSEVSDTLGPIVSIYEAGAPGLARYFFLRLVGRVLQEADVGSRENSLNDLAETLARIASYEDALEFAGGTAAPHNLRAGLAKAAARAAYAAGNMDRGSALVREAVRERRGTGEYDLQFYLGLVLVSAKAGDLDTILWVSEHAGTGDARHWLRALAIMQLARAGLP